MKITGIALGLALAVSVALTASNLCPQETRKVDGITIKPGYPVPNDAATLMESLQLNRGIEVSIYDAKFYGITMPETVQMFGQDRAYASPVWYTPN